MNAYGRVPVLEMISALSVYTDLEERKENCKSAE